MHYWRRMFKARNAWPQKKQMPKTVALPLQPAAFPRKFTYAHWVWNNHQKNAAKREDHEGRGCDFGNRVSNHLEDQSTNSSYPKRSFTGGDFLLHVQKNLVILTSFVLLFEDLIGKKDCFSTLQTYLCSELQKDTHEIALLRPQWGKCANCRIIFMAETIFIGKIVMVIYAALMYHFSELILQALSVIYFRNLFHFPFKFPNPILPKEEEPRRSRKDHSLTAPNTGSFVNGWYIVLLNSFQYSVTWEPRKLQFAEHHMMFLPSLRLEHLSIWAPGPGCHSLCLAQGGLAAFCADTRVTQRSTCRCPAKPSLPISLEKGTTCTAWTSWLSKLTEWVQTACQPMHL